MILKALYDYYERCSSLPLMGTELKEIGYLITLDQDGNFVRIESRMIDNKHASQFLVSQTIQRSGRKFVGNYLWDNCNYVTGFSEKNMEKAQLCKKAFCDRVKEIKETIPQNKMVNAIFSFYQKYPCVYEVLEKDVLWKEMSTSTKNISFLVKGCTSIAGADKDIIAIASGQAAGTDLHICLVTGQKDSISRIHAKVPLSGNAFSSLVSFKDGKGYDSYGKNQGDNAPIGEKAEFAYTTALNHMLASDSRNKFLIGSRTFLFWASKNDEVGQQAEESLFYMFNEDKIDDPDKGILQVRKVFSSIYSGVLKTSLDDKFYILGLAPNSARIAVVYWAELSLYNFAGRISRHLSDMEICGGNKPYMGLRSMLSAVTQGSKSSDATPNLPDAIVKSIFEGTPYPYTLMAECIRRIRAEQSIYTARAAILKAYLNRLNNNEQKIEVMLDKENKNQGYLCGRLFAVLDKIQEEANNQHSIRERYMNAASATPATVFATILNLSSHHSENLSEGRKINFEKLKQEIIEKISADGFPAHLDLQDQGRFFVGYYHQRQDFFVSKSEKDNNNN